ncbi:DMT family transporter [Saccharopolyspora rhizosphaerae]|uniref:DMT family transporter n=1 Tax=Saccharopolyspora rhizosphaerae TaxID=2492662 RepID=A0A3R8Q1Q2_9PSEU|nr:DMT family transporter [Saccharopolyspora rhizosphaerae]RRO15085.1 DMT family transporter [Saccharopolyspora rhizosphaerae]
MTQLANDRAGVRAAPHLGGGLLLALLSAGTFGMSGALARGLLESGWSPGAVVLARLSVGALALAPFALIALRGRWRLLRAQTRPVLIYGGLGMAGTQFCYFSAVSTMDVAPALLIEFTAPVAIVGWLWLRRGQRPTALTLLGAASAIAGLVFALDLASGAGVAWAGAAWAFAAMIGNAAYFLISGETEGVLPPITLAGVGLALSAGILALLGAIGILPMHASSAPAAYAIGGTPWWAPVVALGVLSAAVAYATGTAATRRLGSRLASFVALTEVLASALFAWALLDQRPGVAVVLGGVLIIGGVVLVRLGDRSA